MEWAERRIREAQARGAEIDLFIMPSDAELMLFQAAVKEKIPSESYSVRVGKGGETLATYLAGVKILWTNKLPNGQAWFRYKGGKQELKTGSV